MTRIVFRSLPRLAGLLALALTLQLAPSLYAQRGSTGRNTAAVLAAFKEVVARPSESTVRVSCDGKDVSLGTVVSPDGLIVTKASDLKSKIACKFKDGKQFPARIVGVDEKYDLAMLKVDTSGLKPIVWRTSKAEVGDWVASTSNTSSPAAVGVISVGIRKPNAFEMGPAAPPPNSGFLGIQLRGDEEGNPVVALVTKGSAAEKAGVKSGDVVLSVAGKKVSSAERLIATIQRFRAGEKVVLKVRRGEEEKELKATLDKRPSDLFNRGDRMNQMGSELSARRSGFPNILQHDTVIKPRDCGGPLVDLEGKAVGINIARAGRTESYAVPAEHVIALLADLRSGKLAPKEDVEDDRVAELQGRLEKLREALSEGEKELKELEDDSEENADVRKVTQQKVTELRKKVSEAQSALDKARKDATK